MVKRGKCPDCGAPYETSPPKSVGWEPWMPWIHICGKCQKSFLIGPEDVDRPDTGTRKNPLLHFPLAVMAGLGIFLPIFGVYLLYTDARLRISGEIIAGRVSEIITNKETGQETIVVAFSPQDGQEYRLEALPFPKVDLKEGNVVDVVYLKSDPNVARIKEQNSIASGLAAVIIGVLFLAAFISSNIPATFLYRLDRGGWIPVKWS